MNLTVETGIYILLIAFSHYLIYWWLKRRPQRSINQRHVIVTGGSQGIGLWVAINCAKRGADVTVIARNEEKLKKAVALIRKNCIHENQHINWLSLDLSKDYQTIVANLKEIEDRFGPIYMLVNCAGMALCGTVETMPVDDAQLMMDINYFTTYHPVRHVLAGMKARKEGIIVITSSQLALLGLYGYGAYSASKFALRGLAECIAMEVYPFNVTVTLALPADTDTPGFENEEKTKPEITKILSSSGGLAKPEDVARKIVNDALAGSFFSTFGFESWLLTTICHGLAPIKIDPVLIIFHACIMGPLKLVSYAVQWNFKRTVNKYVKKND